MLPPVMGAVAFIMSDITGISYAQHRLGLDRARAALLLLHLSPGAQRSGALQRAAAARSDIVPLGKALAGGWRHLLPIAALIGLLVAGYTPVYVAAGATAAVIVL